MMNQIVLETKIMKKKKNKSENESNFLFKTKKFVAET